MPPAADVVVIGGGVAGLAIARALQAQGCSVIVFEARDRVGGRLRSVSVGEAGIDLGATWFWANEPRVVGLIDELGLETHPQYLEGDALYQVSGGVHRIAGNPVDVPAGRLKAGMQGLTEALAGSLSEGSLLLEHTVERVRDGGDVLCVEGPWGSIETRHVVIALPPALAIRTLEFHPALPESIRAVAGTVPVWMGAVTKVVVRYEHAFWRDIGLAGSAMSQVGPMREMHDMSGPDGSPAALFGFVPALAPGAPTVTRDAVRGQLEDLFSPDAPEPTEVLICDWRLEEFTTPPEADALQAYETYGHPVFQVAAMGGRLHWASTETALECPGHIEGALSAGARAAAAILLEHGHQSDPNS